jgi:saposin
MKVVVLFLSALIGLTHSQAPLGADRCTWGPAYWCNSIANSKECNAYGHCLSSTWKKNVVLEKDNDEVCQFCETVIQEVKSMLLDQKTRDDIKKLLDSACSVIPSAELSKECATTVNKYLDEVIGIIAAELDPQLICSLMGLCSGWNNKKYTAPQLAVDPVKVEPLCTDCKKFFNDIKDYVKSAQTEKEIEQMIDDQICTNLGSLEDECKELVNTFLPEIIDAIVSAYDPDMICDAFGLCLNSSLSDAKTLFHRMKLRKTPLFRAAKLHGTEECTLCETVLSEVQALTRDAQTQAEVEAFLKSEVCAKLGSMKDACDTTVDSYGSILFEFLANELDPKTRCTSLGFCSAVSNEINAPSRVFAPPKPAVKSSVSTTCVVCEFIMSEIDSLLSDNATEEEIKVALDKVCKLLPETIQNQCLDFVNRYSNAVIELLAQELKPEQVCTALGLCRNTKLSQPKSLKAQNSIITDDMCGVCETVIQYVETLMEDNSTVEEIEKILEKVCNFLPSSLQQQCDDIIEKYGKTIVDMLIAEASPKEICTAIGLCTQKMPVMLEIIKPQAQLPLGMNPCTYGPSYWCASRANAESCKTVAHCEKHGWLSEN